MTVPSSQSRTRQMLVSLLAAGSLCAILSPPVAQAQPGARPAAPMGGSIAVRDPQVPDCLDPQKTILGASDAIFEEVFDTLVSIDDKGHIVPDLATRYAFSNGGTVITFYLRHGVRFSNGDALDASSVKFTFDRALDPKTKSPGTGGYLSLVKSTVALDKYTVRVTLKKPYRPILTQLAIGYEGILDPKAVAAEGSKYCQYPVGSGPFKVQSVGPGFNTVTLVRNPYHTYEPSWARHQGPAFLQQIVFKPIVSDATATSSLLSGGLDISSVTGPQLSRVQHNASIGLVHIPQQGEYYLGFNQSHKPFDNVAVRRAIAEAIDRAQLIKAATNGLAIPAYSPIPSTLPFYDPAAKTYAPQYNVADAQKLISANHATGPYTLLTFSDPTSSSAAELIQAELAQVGVNVKIVAKPIADYIPIAAKGQFDMNILGWGWPDPDFVYNLFHSSQATSAGINYLFYKSATLDNLIVQGRQATDAASAARIYAQLQHFMDTNVLIDPLWISLTITGVRSRVKGFHTSSTTALLYQDLYIGQ